MNRFLSFSSSFAIWEFLLGTGLEWTRVELWELSKVGSDDFGLSCVAKSLEKMRFFVHFWPLRFYLATLLNLKW